MERAGGWRWEEMGNKGYDLPDRVSFHTKISQIRVSLDKFPNLPHRHPQACSILSTTLPALENTKLGDLPLSVLGRIVS